MANNDTKNFESYVQKKTALTIVCIPACGIYANKLISNGVHSRDKCNK